MTAYEALLPRHLDTTIAGVRDTWRELQITGKPVCRSLQPIFIDRAFHDVATRDAALVVRAFHIASAHMAPRLGLSRRILELLELALAHPTVTMVRLDGFPRGESLAFLESNAIGQVTMPAGIGDGDVLRAAFLALPIMREFAERFEVRDVSTTALGVDAVIEAHRARGGTGLPTIAVVEVKSETGAAPRPVAQERDQLRLMNHATERGCRIRTCQPRELRFAEGRLQLGDERVDVVFVADDTGSYFEVCPDDAPILAAVRAGAVTLGDGFPLGALAHDKKTFDFLTDPDAGVPLDDDEARAVRSCLPWTRICADRRTTYHGEPVELRPFVLSNRDRLVLKPTSSYGGNGVVLGWRVGKVEWSAAVERAFGAGGYIVQERVHGAQVRLPMLDDASEVRSRGVLFDLNPYVWMGTRSDGWWARVSPSELMNVTAGEGSEVPVFVIESGGL